MPTVDEAVENITWAAGDSFLSNYLDEVLDEVFERAEEDCVEPDEVLDEVVAEWLDRTYIYDEVYDYLYEHIDNECMYTSDCMEIIADYGFSESLSAAQDMGAWPRGTQAIGHGRRTCGGCDLSNVTESAVASAVLHQNLPSVEELQEEIVGQIQECSSYLERVAEYENSNRESVDEEDGEEDECDERDDDGGKCDGNEREGDA
jgi:hypothetical protein